MTSQEEPEYQVHTHTHKKTRFFFKYWVFIRPHTTSLFGSLLTIEGQLHLLWGALSFNTPCSLAGNWRIICIRRKTWAWSRWNQAAPEEIGTPSNAVEQGEVFLSAKRGRDSPLPLLGPLGPLGVIWYSACGACNPQSPPCCRSSLPLFCHHLPPTMLQQAYQEWPPPHPFRSWSMIRKEAKGEKSFAFNFSSLNHREQIPNSKNRKTSL